MNKNSLALLLIIAVSVILSTPLLESGFFLHHDNQQIARLFVFDEALRSGQFPVRWVDRLGFGFGYPLFNFYPPLVYSLGEVFHLVGFGFINSIKLVIFSSFVLSGMAMYIFIKEIWGKSSALVSSLFYLLVPYRALDIYVRGALAESFSLVWLPLILWSYFKLYKDNNNFYIHVSALFLALLMITHNLIFLPFVLLLPFYLLYLILISKNKKSLVLGILFSGLLALGLSAFFWAPALLEKQFTLVDELLLVNLASYNIHFVYPQQLWNWTWGYGGSAEGLTDGLSFKIGKLHIFVSIAALILFLLNINKFKQKIRLPIIFFLLFILSAFMTTGYSKVIWDILTPLAYLQFPWRFLIFTALFSSILAGSLISFLRFTIFKIVIGIMLILLLFIPNLKLFQPKAQLFDITDESETSDEAIKWEVSSSSFEYLPRGTNTYTSEINTNLVDIKKEDIPQEKIKIISGEAKISQLSIKPHKITFKLHASTDSKVQVNIDNFPGWQVSVNDQVVQIDDKNKYKLINFDIGSGENNVIVEFKNTLIRTIANTFSLLSVMILIILVLKKWLIHKAT